MTKDEALKLALEALEDLGMKHFENTGEVLYKDTFTAIKEALMSVPDGAQPEHGWTSERIAGIARLKEAQDKKLAQPSVSVEQEPVAWGFQNSAITGSNRWMVLREQIPTNDQYGGALWTPLYTTPPPVTEPHKRPSRSDIKPLSDEEIILIVADCASSHQHTDIHFARAIEAAHGIKENT